MKPRRQHRLHGYHVAYTARTQGMLKHTIVQRRVSPTFQAGRCSTSSFSCMMPFFRHVVLFLLLSCCLSQQFQDVAITWTHSFGNLTENENGVYTGPKQHPGAHWVTNTVLLDSDNLLIFGGYGYGATTGYDYLNDLWHYTISTQKWTYLSGSHEADNSCPLYPAGPPSARWCAQTWRYNSTTMMLFGGGELGDIRFKNDLWRYTLGHEWEFLGGDEGDDIISNHQSRPYWIGGRRSSSYARIPDPDSDSKRLIFHAGKGCAETCVGARHSTLDVWVFDFEILEWEFVRGPETIDTQSVLTDANPANIHPGGRLEGLGWATAQDTYFAFSGMVYDDQAVQCYLNDLWKFALSTGLWEYQSGATRCDQDQTGTYYLGNGTNKPGGRDIPQAFRFGSWMMLFGGDAFDIARTFTEPMEDVWVLSATDYRSNGNWLWLAGSENHGAPRPLDFSSPGPRVGCGYDVLWWDGSGETGDTLNNEGYGMGVLWGGGYGYPQSGAELYADVWILTFDARDRCYGVVAAEGACSGPERGVCTQGNCVCTSESSFYGSECQETISGARWGSSALSNRVEIRIDFDAPTSLIETVALTECEKIVLNVEDLGTDPTCQWVGGTPPLVITLDETDALILETEIIRVNPISDPGTGVEFDLSASWISTYYLAFVGAGVALVVLLIGFVCVVLVCCIVCIRVRKAKAEKGGKGNRSSASGKEMTSSIPTRNDSIVVFDDGLTTTSGEKDDSMAHLKINASLFEVKFDSIKLVRELGKGGSDAVVYQGIWEHKNVAFKVFRTRDIGMQDDYDLFEKEVSLLSSVNHPNILQFYGASLKPPRVGILLEFCEKGDMTCYIRNILQGRDSWDAQDRVRLLFEVASALSYLHNRRIVHRDVKCDNVLLTKDLTAKLSDFGLSKVCGGSRNTTRVGTSWYMAPEVTYGGEYNTAVDAYSFGIMMFEVCEENLHPYGLDLNFSVELKAAADPTFRPKPTAKTPPWAVHLMTQMWDSEPSVRPQMKDVAEQLGGMLGTSFEGQSLGDGKSEGLRSFKDFMEDGRKSSLGVPARPSPARPEHRPQSSPHYYPGHGATRSHAPPPPQQQ